MAKSTILAIKIIADASKAAKGFRQAEKETSKFERGLKQVTPAAAAIGGALAGAAVIAGREASRLQQSAGATASVFGKQSKQIEKLARAAADGMGLSRSEYQETAAVFGAQLKNMGLAATQLVPTTDRLMKLGGDLAATFGGSTSEAVAALSSLLRGERDPIERYGVSIKQADINARLAAQGQSKLTGEAKRAAETQATLSLLTEQTSAAQGQFARESGTAEVAQQKAAAKFKNAAAALGTSLLPAVTAAATALAALAGWVEKNKTAALAIAGTLGVFAAAVLAANVAVKAYAAAQTIWAAKTYAVAAAQKVAAAAQWALNAAMTANPVGVIVAAIVALVAGFVLLYKKNAAFRAMIQAVMAAARAAVAAVAAAVGRLVDWFKSKLPAALAIMKTAAVLYLKLVTLPIRVAVTLVARLVEWVRSKAPAAFNTMKTAAVAAFNKITAPIRAAIDLIARLISKIKTISWPKPPKWVTKIGNGIGNVFGESSRQIAAGYAYRPANLTRPGELFAAQPATTVGRYGSNSAAPVVINIYGALDPAATARQIDRVLARGRVASGRAA